MLATKLHIPRIHAKIVVRPRLLALLHEGQQRKVTILAAPAGYGKTTCLSEWASVMQKPVAWFSLDASDQDQMRFWRYTIEALDIAVPSFNGHKLRQLAQAEPKSESLVTALLNELNQLNEPTSLIWDDLHLIVNLSLFKEIDRFLNRLPPHVHIYIASRTLLPLSLAKLSAAEEAAVLGIEALRFTREEAAELIVGTGQNLLTASEVDHLYERTEGWAVGMRLLTLSLGREGSGPCPKTKGAVGHNYLIADYFFQEVYTRMPVRLQEFMVKTSILNHLNADLCKVVTGMMDSALLLEEMERMNLFLVSLDQERTWYRYHHAFQNFLQSRLKTFSVRKRSSLHQSAGRWLEQNGQSIQAIEHYLSAGDFDKSLDLVEELTPMLIAGEWMTLMNWLNHIPQEMLFQKPQLYFIHIGVLYLCGQVKESTDRYWEAIERLEDPALVLDERERSIWQAGLAFLVATRAYIERDFATFIEYSRLYLEYRPAGDFLVGFGLGLDGHHRLWESVITTGGLSQAEDFLREIWELWSETDNVYLIAHFAIDYGKLHYERNDMQEAETYYQKALDIGKAQQNAYLTVLAASGLATVYLASDFPERADILLAAIRKQFVDERYPSLTKRLQWFDALRAWREGEMNIASEWLSNSGLGVEDEIQDTMLEQYDTAACIMAAQGQIDEAILLLDALLSIARRLERHSDVIRILIHRSIILDRADLKTKSLYVLEEALSLAEPEGYIRTFLDEGEQLLLLLNRYAEARRARRHRVKYNVSMAYIKKLLRLMNSREKKLTLNAACNLTPREKMIFQLMGEGFSNREIAGHLSVSLTTVKTHINNLYRKLGVSKREEAIQRWQW